MAFFRLIPQTSLTPLALFKKIKIWSSHKNCKYRLITNPNGKKDKGTDDVFYLCHKKFSKAGALKFVLSSNSVDVFFVSLYYYDSGCYIYEASLLADCILNLKRYLRDSLKQFSFQRFYSPYIFTPQHRYPHLLIDFKPYIYAKDLVSEIGEMIDKIHGQLWLSLTNNSKSNLFCDFEYRPDRIELIFNFNNDKVKNSKLILSFLILLINHLTNHFYDDFDNYHFFL